MKPLPTLRQLSYLVALADHRHFGRAAEHCLVTQSTLSAGLQELENLLGVTLVERTKRRVMLTPLGQDIVARARRLLRDAEDLADTARAAAKPLTGLIRLGVIPTIGPYLLPRVLPGLRARYPELKLHLREDQTARLLDGLARGDLDVVLLALPYDAEEVEAADIAGDPFLLACRPDHPLAKLDRVGPQDLAKADLLLLEEGHCLRQHALAACSLPAVKAGQGLQATSLHTLVQMVANGLGVTLLPRMAIDAELTRGTELVLRPLAGDAPERRIGLVWRRGTPRRDEFRLLSEELRTMLAG